MQKIVIMLVAAGLIAATPAVFACDQAELTQADDGQARIAGYSLKNKVKSKARSETHQAKHKAKKKAKKKVEKEAEKAVDKGVNKAVDAATGY
jgi:outer membrane lipoprotein-sorting protein